MRLTRMWRSWKTAFIIWSMSRMARKQDFSSTRNTIVLPCSVSAKARKVLDCFTHMGTFALNAGIVGAADVTGLDISEYAVSQAEANARLNHLENTVHFRQANVLDELPKLAQAEKNMM